MEMRSPSVTKRIEQQQIEREKIQTLEVRVKAEKFRLSGKRWSFTNTIRITWCHRNLKGLLK